MKKCLLLLFLVGLILPSCKSKKTITVLDYTQYREEFTPQEQSLAIRKITNEANEDIAGCRVNPSFPRLSSDFVSDHRGGNVKSLSTWRTPRQLAISPDGAEIAYITYNNRQYNVMTRNAWTQGAATQRTFREVNSVSWGNDGKLYFSNQVGAYYQIASVDSHRGSLMRQYTNNNYDWDPVVSPDGTTLFFTRCDGHSRPAIWSLNLTTGALTMCALGYNVCLLNSNEFLCVRNNTAGNSEIWRVNFVHGTEQILLANKDISFTNPCLSPNGKWVACVGNTRYQGYDVDNLDIFVVRADGSRYQQITNHPANDSNPVFSRDGGSIFFISDRSTNPKKFNVWALKFDSNED